MKTFCLIAGMVILSAGHAIAESPNDALRMMETSCFYYGWVPLSTCETLTIDNAAELLQQNAFPLAQHYCGDADVSVAMQLLVDGKAQMPDECRIVLDIAQDRG